MSEDQATVAEEEYLQIIYWLQEAGLPMTGANIARATLAPVIGSPASWSQKMIWRYSSSATVASWAIG